MNRHTIVWLLLVLAVGAPRAEEAPAENPRVTDHGDGSFEVETRLGKVRWDHRFEVDPKPVTHVRLTKGEESGEWTLSRKFLLDWQTASQKLMLVDGIAELAQTPAYFVEMGQLLTEELEAEDLAALRAIDRHLRTLAPAEEVARAYRSLEPKADESTGARCSDTVKLWFATADITARCLESAPAEHGFVCAAVAVTTATAAHFAWTSCGSGKTFVTELPSTRVEASGP